MELSSLNIHCFIHLFKFLNRNSFINLSKTCKELHRKLYLILQNLKKETWCEIDLYKENSINNIFNYGYRFIRIKNDNRVLQVINFNHCVFNKNFYVYFIYIHDGVGLKDIQFYKKDNCKIEYLKSSPLLCKIKPIKNRKHLIDF